MSRKRYEPALSCARRRFSRSISLKTVCHHLPFVKSQGRPGHLARACVDHLGGDERFLNLFVPSLARLDLSWQIDALGANALPCFRN